MGLDILFLPFRSSVHEGESGPVVMSPSYLCWASDALRPPGDDECARKRCPLHFCIRYCIVGTVSWWVDTLQACDVHVCASVCAGFFWGGGWGAGGMCVTAS